VLCRTCGEAVGQGLLLCKEIASAREEELLLHESASHRRLRARCGQLSEVGLRVFVGSHPAAADLNDSFRLASHG
jgi:hypothetical protein